jgi:hypothetical protein
VRPEPRAVQQACQCSHWPPVLPRAVLLRRGRAQQCVPDAQQLRRAALRSWAEVEVPFVGSPQFTVSVVSGMKGPPGRDTGLERRMV